ncbi:MAG: hypothetical protein ABI988_02985 [Nitrospirota bacterium]
MCRIVLAWQNRSPAGPVVLHLELELKQYKHGKPEAFIKLEREMFESMR